jgi:ABC-type multidrug transport system fused ATPase/permease subunit
LFAGTIAANIAYGLDPFFGTDDPTSPSMAATGGSSCTSSAAVTGAVVPRYSVTDSAGIGAGAGGGRASITGSVSGGVSSAGGNKNRKEIRRRVIKAAKLANAHDFITNFPKVSIRSM